MAREIFLPFLNSEIDKLCNRCLSLDLVTEGKLPWEEDAALPHQPDLNTLAESARSCTLCYQVWSAAGWSFGGRGGMTMYSPERMIDGRAVAIQRQAANVEPQAVPGMSMFILHNGTSHDTHGRNIEPNVQPLHWVDPAEVVEHFGKDPKKVGSYLFGTFYKSSNVWREKGGDSRLQLVGLGVRLGTSPRIEDAVGNEPNVWYLCGTYLRFRTEYGMSMTFP